MDDVTPLLDRISAFFDIVIFSVGDTHLTTGKLVGTTVFIVVTWIVAELVRRWLVFRVLRRSKVQIGVQHATARIFSYLVWIVAMLIGLPMIGIHLESIIFAFGALGVGLSFGLQKITDNFVSGIIILFENPIKVGDRVRVGETYGTVKKIGARATQVQTNDQIVILVPNSEFISERITNLSHGSKVVRFTFAVGVSYESDVETVREALLAAGRALPGVMTDPAPEVLFDGFGESSLDFRLWVATEEMVHQPERFRSQANFQIWHQLNDRGIKIPFPQRDLHLKSVSPEARGVVAA